MQFLVLLLSLSLSAFANELEESKAYRLKTPTSNGYDLLIRTIRSSQKVDHNRVSYHAHIRLAKEDHGKITSRTEWMITTESSVHADLRRFYGYRPHPTLGLHRNAFPANFYARENLHAVLFYDDALPSWIEGQIGEEQINSDLEAIPHLLHPASPYAAVYDLVAPLQLAKGVVGDTLLVMPSKEISLTIDPPTQPDRLGLEYRDSEGPSTHKMLVRTVVLGKKTPDGILPVHTMGAETNLEGTMLEVGKGFSNKAKFIIELMPESKRVAIRPTEHQRRKLFELDPQRGQAESSVPTNSIHFYEKTFEEASKYDKRQKIEDLKVCSIF